MKSIEYIFPLNKLKYIYPMYNANLELKHLQIILITWQSETVLQSRPGFCPRVNPYPSALATDKSALGGMSTVKQLA